MSDARPFLDLSHSGLLWLINRVVFHPRGFALALDIHDGVATGWRLQGDGSEPWSFTEGDDQGRFVHAEATLRDASNP